MDFFSKKINQNRRPVIHYEQIAAGLLTKLDEFDDYDIHIIANQMTKQGLEVCAFGTQSLYNINKYVKVSGLEEGITRLNNNIKLDNMTENGIILKDYLNQISGKEVFQFLKKYDFDKHIKLKNEYLKEITDLILNNTNVLLISNDDNQINELKNYGYKNVNSFKSIIRADKYFQNNPKELENYDLVLIGNQDLETHNSSNIKLISSLYELQNNRKLTLMHFDKVDYERDLPYTLFVGNLSRIFTYFKHYNTITDVYDKVTKQLKINYLIKPIFNKTLKKIEETINDKKIELPTRKNEIKILFCECMHLGDYSKDVVNNLNLKAELIADNNSTKGKIQDKLADYDIIIVSDMYSRAIVNYIKECNEQCKDSGRKLVMLVSYDGSSFVSKDYYNEVKLSYDFAGELAHDSKKQFKEFNRIFNDEDMKTSDLSEYEYKNKELVQGVLEEVINIYNDKLKEISVDTISDLDFKTADTYQKEFEEEYIRRKKIKEEENKRKKKELEPLMLYYNARKELLNYLYYKSKGLIYFKEKIDGINIIEELSNSDYGKITVENVYEGKTLCTISFNKKFMTQDEANGNVVIFDVETLNSKGNLEKSNQIGLYTSDYKTKYSNIEYANEKQFKALEATCKKIIRVLSPINEQAYNRLQEIKNGTYSYSKKRRNKKRYNK